MSEKKKQDFGLPDIGGRSVAATLIGRRSVAEDRDDEAASAQPSPARDADSTALVGATTAMPPVEPTKPTQPLAQPLESDASSGTAPVRNVGGRPRKDSRRMHLAFASPIAEYLELAWRTHRRPDGSLAAGPSSLIEDLLIEHRRRNSA